MYFGTVDNLWYKLLQDNLHLFSDNNKVNANFYTNTKIAVGARRKSFVNFFGLDGRSYEHIYDLALELYEKKHLVKLPLELIKEEPTVFFNDGEGHGPSELFDAIHMLIDVCKLEGHIRYENSSVNISDIYTQYCRNRMMLPKMSVDYTGNPSFFDPNNKHYALPKNYSFTEQEDTNKKLYCSFNWNAWDHRLGLIALLHYYNLLNDGYVTSPGKNKYGYSDEDYKVLYDCSTRYLTSLDVYNSVIESLNSLKGNYPLKIDDRSQYVDTDTPLMDVHLKLPLYEARRNSLFEIVCETRFTKEHWFSEKTFWPIKVARPFFIVNGAGCLQSLKKLGFKTYADYIDESYDIEQDVPKKLQKICKEVIRLQNLRTKDPDTFYQMYNKLKEIAQHNSEVFKNRNVNL